MANGFRLVFECPHCRRDIRMQKTCAKVKMNETDVFGLFGRHAMFCSNPDCGWHGNVSAAKLLQITGFQWLVGSA